MSISSEITRISNAKTAIAESIANKGVTVPSGTKIDGMAALIDSIQTGGGAVQPSKALTVTSNGTTTITPDAPYEAIKQVDLTVNVASGGGGAEPATLTITSQNYTGNRYGMFIFVNSEGHLERLDYTLRPNTFKFPITVETVLGGVVAFVPDGFLGLPFYRNPIGCETDKYLGVFYILVTSSQASVEIYNND